MLTQIVRGQNVWMQPGTVTINCPTSVVFYDNNIGCTPSTGVGCITTTGSSACPYITSSTGNYIQNQNVIETFVTSNGSCILGTPGLNSVGIGANDSLRIFDGPSIGSPQIAKYGPNYAVGTPATFNSTSPALTFWFQADNDAVTVCKGWQITLSCTACPSAPVNDACANATLLSTGSTCSYLAGYINSVTLSTGTVSACPGTTAGGDVWYKFTANNSSDSIRITSTAPFQPVVQAFSGTCSSLTQIGCGSASSAGGTALLGLTGLTVGTTYYFRVYNYTGSSPTTFNFNVCVKGSAPTDCAGATEICSTSTINGTFSWGNYGIQEYTAGTFGCITQGESTSSWLYFQCQTSGTLGFNITSSNGTFQDVDWALWNDGTSFHCPVSSSPIRCSYAQGFASNSYGLPAYSTGLQAAETDVSECAGTCGGTANAFVDTVHMVAGRYYVLMMNLWNGNLNYQLTWNLTDGATFNNCVLPIQLASFDGKNLGSVNWLYWMTQSELNNDHFVLQRSGNGSDFSDIATIKGQGNSTVESDYDYYDEHPLNGINYYRLKQVDENGGSSYSDVISLESIHDASTLVSIYPNPTQGIFDIKWLAGEDCSATIEITNEVGKQIMSMPVQIRQGNNSFPVDITGFDRGVYFIKLNACGIGQVLTEKLVKL